jgi:glycerol-3-phosphate acyltransferase PlsY
MFALSLAFLTTPLAPLPLWALVALVAVVGYVVGAIPTAYVITKAVKNIDIRQHGSGNVGGTNVWRTCGKWWGWLTYLLDCLKGYFPVAIVLAVAPPHLAWLALVMAFAVLVGHSKSVFLGFAGGKASISGLGTILAFSPLGGLLGGVLAFTLIGITRMVSVASIVAALVTWALVWLAGGSLMAILYTAVAGLYVIIRHKSNIVRLMQGTENKV